MPLAFVILGLDPRIHAATYGTRAAEQDLHRRRNIDVTAWIPGSARVASLLAPPWNDDMREVPANFRGLRFAFVTIVGLGLAHARRRRAC